MIKKTIAYTDYNGNKREEDFYFNLSKAELAEMELSTTGGLEQMIKGIVAAQDMPKIIELFKKIILKSYGVKSADGRTFVKSEELTTEFTQTEAYSELFMELATDSEKAAVFVNGIMPADMQESLANHTDEIPELRVFTKS